MILFVGAEIRYQLISCIKFHTLRFFIFKTFAMILKIFLFQFVRIFYDNYNFLFYYELVST